MLCADLAQTLKQLFSPAGIGFRNSGDNYNSERSQDPPGGWQPSLSDRQVLLDQYTSGCFSTPHKARPTPKMGYVLSRLFWKTEFPGPRMPSLMLEAFFGEFDSNEFWNYFNISASWFIEAEHT